MKIVGLTGGIGCGKTTVSHLFERLGVPVIDADVVSHALTQPHAVGWTALVERWGSTFLGTDGVLDRARLREVFFRDPAMKSEWESILHPLIFSAVQSETQCYIQARSSHQIPYLIWSVPLLFESRSSLYRERLARTLVVDVPVEYQIQRVLQRGVPPATIYAILSMQVSRRLRQLKADDLLINIMPSERLPSVVNTLHDVYMRMFA